MLMTISLTFIMTISIFIMSISFLIYKTSSMDREKMSPFECGFDPKTKNRFPFSLRFFLISIIFLIFDVELALIIPVPIILKFTILNSWLVSSSIFMIILVIGLFHEWMNGSLNWSC